MSNSKLVLVLSLIVTSISGCTKGPFGFFSSRSTPIQTDTESSDAQPSNSRGDGPASQPSRLGSAPTQSNRAFGPSGTSQGAVASDGMGQSPSQATGTGQTDGSPVRRVSFPMTLFQPQAVPVQEAVSQSEQSVVTAGATPSSPTSPSSTSVSVTSSNGPQLSIQNVESGTASQFVGATTKSLEPVPAESSLPQAAQDAAGVAANGSDVAAAHSEAQSSLTGADATQAPSHKEGDSIENKTAQADAPADTRAPLAPAESQRELDLGVTAPKEIVKEAAADGLIVNKAETLADRQANELEQLPVLKSLPSSKFASDGMDAAADLVKSGSDTSAGNSSAGKTYVASGSLAGLAPAGAGAMVGAPPSPKLSTASGGPVPAGAAPASTGAPRVPAAATGAIVAGTPTSQVIDFFVSHPALASYCTASENYIRRGLDSAASPTARNSRMELALIRQDLGLPEVLGGTYRSSGSTGDAELKRVREALERARSTHNQESPEVALRRYLTEKNREVPSETIRCGSGESVVRDGSAQVLRDGIYGVGCRPSAGGDLLPPLQVSRVEVVAMRDSSGATKTSLRVCSYLGGRGTISYPVLSFDAHQTGQTGSVVFERIINRQEVFKLTRCADLDLQSGEINLDSDTISDDEPNRLGERSVRGWIEAQMPERCEAMRVGLPSDRLQKE